MAARRLLDDATGGRALRTARGAPAEPPRRRAPSYLPATRVARVRLRPAASFIDAVEAFGERLAAVQLGVPGPGRRPGVTSTWPCARAAWQNILRAALPGERDPLPHAFGAYCAGVGVNAVIPARAGDLMKMFLVRRAVPNAGYATLTGSLVCETVVDCSSRSGAADLGAVRRGPAGRAAPATSRRSTSRWRCGTRSGRLRSSRAILVLVVMLLAGGCARSGASSAAAWRSCGPRARYLRSVVELPGGRLGLPGRRRGVLPARLRRPRDASTAALIVQVAGSLGGLFPATPGRPRARSRRCSW